MNIEILSKASNQARGLAIDAVHACQSGHIGLPLGAAEIGAVLFGHALSFNPRRPAWINRDRFVLSAGHGSMFLYAWLHLSGFDLSMEEIRNFRGLNSKTPGHPEFGEVPGVEATTGPLGQGVGNAVGMAVAAKMVQSQFNTSVHQIVDHHVVCLAGDGCLQEGVASEACSFAGHFGLDNFILIYDSNDVTLDASAEATQSEDAEARFQAYGFETITVDGHDLVAILEAFERFKTNDNGRPKFIVAKTLIGKGIPEVAGTAAAHGEGGHEFSETARRGLDLPDDPYFVSDDVREYFADRQNALIQSYSEWEEVFSAWEKVNPEKAELLTEGLKRHLPDDLLGRIPQFSPEDSLATRAAGSAVLQPLSGALPLLISGSADLHGSTKNYIESSDDFTRDNRGGRNIRFGIREHAMGAMVNGIGYYGVFQGSGATSLAFSDYMRPSIRLAALSSLPVFFIFTHDSIGVGEDGPTHQPVEMVSSLRLIPNLDVLRPADPEETAGAFVAALERRDGPSALILSRQNLPNLNDIPIPDRREGTLNGGYVAKSESGELNLILLATGSELHLAIEAAQEIGEGTRVVSMPCFERFDRQSAGYRESVLPSSCRKRIAIEAGVTGLWHRFVGPEGKIIGIERFGLSAPGPVVMEELGISAHHITATAAEIQ